MISSELIKLNFAPLNLAVEVCGLETDLSMICNISFTYMSEMHKSMKNAEAETWQYSLGAEI